MGEATYYMKAQFASEQAAQEALPKFKALVKEGIAAADWWQDHRYYEHEGKRAEFWKEFREKFPTITKYATTFGLIDGDCNNNLAGVLDFGGGNGDDENAQVEGDTISYYATVWHFADWCPFMDFVKSELGAKKTG